jgi:hypothetical protein
LVTPSDYMSPAYGIEALLVLSMLSALPSKNEVLLDWHAHVWKTTHFVGSWSYPTWGLGWCPYGATSIQVSKFTKGT